MFCLCVCGREGGLEELFHKNFGQALTAQIRTLDDSGTDHKTRGMEITSPSGSLLKDTGAQTKRGDLHRTPDQPPCGREKEKQSLWWFPRGIGEQAIEERNTIYTLEDKRTTEQAYRRQPPAYQQLGKK